MALEETDRAEIARMIAEASKQNTPPIRAPQGQPAPSQDAWENMSDRQRQNYVRTLVEEASASLDAEYERENLKRENEELRAKVAEWEKAGKPGRRPTRATAGGDDKRDEEPPTLVSKAYTWLFGEATAPTTRAPR